ncbi:MAG: helix-turn-helix domain-containing protein [Porphyromonas sp.]|uniref:helix-turn-helix domain-containing protein n=1 Tax=Porphyromonas sp. TaxID=1924944 RepID=UPI002A7EC057|nr:helix-turn-helix domain-containing protein [Porphyromonas sp.]MDY4245750.1 helix-turn-helix domain-containing protein [Porphyromonas sp.]
MATTTMDDIKRQLDRIEQYAGIASKEVLDLEEAITYTGCARSTLYRLTSAKEIPHYKLGQALRFKKSELDEWLTRNKVATNREIESKAVTYMTLRDKGYTRK